MAEYCPPANAAGPDRFGVLIRHRGFIDRIARAVPADDYYSDEADIRHWVGSKEHDRLRFPTREAAQEMADQLTEMFGPQKYRFSVIEERLVPRWFLVEPEPGEREKIPVGAVEQL